MTETLELYDPLTLVPINIKSVPTFGGRYIDETQSDKYPLTDVWIDRVVIRAEEFINSTQSWRCDKEQEPGVANKRKGVTSQSGETLHWCVRQSFHSELSFEIFKRGLFYNHPENEAKYIPSIIDVHHMFNVGPKISAYKNTYKMPWPLTKRQMLELVITASPTPKSFYVVSLPLSGQQDDRCVRGMYVSVEYVEEMEDGKVEWTMATASDAGGNLPRSLQNPAIPSQIAKDVPHFLAWAKKEFGKS